MGSYVYLVTLLNFTVILLLLMGTNSLCGYPLCVGKSVVAAVFGGICCGICLLPATRFLGRPVWRLLILVSAGWIAFGWKLHAMRRIAIFLLLNMALNGMASGLHGGIWALLFAAACISFLCILGMRGITGTGTYVPVELMFRGKRVRLLALRDTGNTLHDPVTGSSVLVIGADAARELTGLTDEHLHHPIETVTAQLLPGLRLVPYKSVGQPGGMLLAMRITQAQIGNRKCSTLVAFAPDTISPDGAYQALTGGNI